MFTYFWNGLQHFLFALALVAAWGKLSRKPIPSGFGFWLGIVITSSAVFFLPTHVPFLGRNLDFFYQFLHYPVSDWDLLVLGGTWHRSFITHSGLLMFPLLVIQRRTLPTTFAQGFVLGLSSHLVWDGISSSMMTRIVFLPGLLVLSGMWAKAWLVVNGLLLYPLLPRFEQRK